MIRFGGILAAALVVGAAIRRTGAGTPWKIAFAVMMVVLPAGRLMVRPTTSAVHGQSASPRISPPNFRSVTPVIGFFTRPVA